MENKEEKTWGGARKGAGRPKSENPKGRVKQFKTFSVSLSLEDYEKFEQAFLKSGYKSKSRFIFESLVKN